MGNGSEITKKEAGQALASVPEAAMAKLENITIDMIMLNPQVFAALEKMAAVMASARCMIPEHLINKPGDCFAIIMQAILWRMNPFAVAQKTHLVNGKLGYEAQLVNAVVTGSGLIKGLFKYDFYGPWEKLTGKPQIKTGQNGKTYQVPAWRPEDEKGCGVKVSAIIKETGDCETIDLFITQASVRNSPLWLSNPKQQLGYLAVKNWARLYTPGAILGVYTPDELEEIPAKEPEKNITPHFQPPKEKAPEAAPEAKLSFDVQADEVQPEPEAPQEPEQEPPPEDYHEEEQEPDDAGHRYDENDLPPSEENGETITKKQQGLFFVTLDKKSGLPEGEVRDLLFKKWGYKSTSEIKKSDFNAILRWLSAGCQNEPNA